MRTIALVAIIVTTACNATAAPHASDRPERAARSVVPKQPSAAEPTPVPNDPHAWARVTIGDPELHFIVPNWPTDGGNGKAHFVDEQRGGELWVHTTTWDVPVPLEALERDWRSTADASKTIVKPYQRSSVDLPVGTATLFDYQLRLADGGAAQGQTYLFLHGNATYLMRFNWLTQFTSHYAPIFAGILESLHW